MKFEAKDSIDPITECHFAHYTKVKNSTCLHWHDFYEIFLISNGQVMHIINGKRELLSDGSLIFMRPDDAHGYEEVGELPCEMFNLSFPTHMVDALQLFLGDGFSVEQLLRAPLPPKVQLSTQEKKHLLEEFDRLFVSLQHNKHAIRHQLKAFLATVLTRFFGETEGQTEVSLPQWLTIVCREMKKKENFTEGLSRLYEIANMSPEYISRTFKKYFNKTPTEWINEMRLQYAANMLVISDEEIVAIAYDSGFQNLSYFYHKFKEKYNITPFQYRKKNRKYIIP